MPSAISKNILVARIAFCVTAAICFGAGAWVFCEWYFFPGIPPKAALKFAEGTVAWSQGKKNEIRFRLAGVPQLLVYSRPSGNIGLVAGAVHSQMRPAISVLFNVAPRRCPFAEIECHEVYEVSASSGVLSNYIDVVEAWRQHEIFLPWLSVFILLGGVLQLYIAMRGVTQPNNSLKRTAAGRHGVD